MWDFVIVKSSQTFVSSSRYNILGFDIVLQWNDFKYNLDLCIAIFSFKTFNAENYFSQQTLKPSAAEKYKSFRMMRIACCWN